MYTLQLLLHRSAASTIVPCTTFPQRNAAFQAKCRAVNGLWEAAYPLQQRWIKFRARAPA
jgi:hypothetical protein